MASTLIVDPVTRLEGHLRAKVVVDAVQGQQQVVSAEIGGTLFRGFEKIMMNRSPLDAPDICERICGVCSVSHGLAACQALEHTTGLVIPNNARVMRNLILAADTLQSHILHFYTLTLPDFCEMQQMAPWTPEWLTDRRISGAAAATLKAHYTKALEIRRKTHEMGALFAGRLPHSPALVPGGVTTTPRQTRIDAFRAYAQEVLDFVNNEYQSDVYLIAAGYADYYSAGGGPRNLISFGGYDLDNTGSFQLFSRGISQDAALTPAALDVNAILEDITYGWYSLPSIPVAVRTNAGGAEYTDPMGLLWSADSGFSNGVAGSTDTAIIGAAAQPLYQTWRYGPVGTPLVYTFSNLLNGSYSVTLKFDETDFTQAGQRSFAVKINGTTVLSKFDIFVAAGGAFMAVDRKVTGKVTNGQMVIQFVPVVDVPRICAIQITANIPQSAMEPYRGITTPSYPKNARAYSWIKAPRYNKASTQTGPLARMWVNGEYQNGISVMDRHMARFREALKLSQLLDGWAQELVPTAPVYERYAPPLSGAACGMLEAPRGALGHWLGITNGKISLYQVVTPTCWNASPRDVAGVNGPLEQALIGVPVQNMNEPVEVVRIIHSFDPCLACAVHVMRPSQEGKVFQLR